ncbi:tetratricopeptide repeat protein [Novosphingobium album (ex Liu et al. 2023)]|uniref:SPOR domain-containing protein n=1 Tax=Novosphingobium album (ex Liu et al. 2023) TaxID=3031130 RepID=A0ABT5WK32_9SPHN|nr:tetratricopeptide repeat protein [Novosphingobium album (ex Liu et al. 2023)]MDE8650404.1 SPOR domain-containing protein [Novosphingobium album (ex Liu et al. 2023)]
MRFDRRLAGYLANAAVAAALGFPACGIAQTQGAVPTVSRAVVQPLPGRDALRLNAALSRLGRDPRDVDALIEAGEAANAMGDVEAAAGFFKRADQIAAGNPKVKAGLAGAMVLSGNPVDAIPLFEQAEKAGATPTDIGADRGLAYDLVGDNATAQKFYTDALSRKDDDAVRMRLALSQAIAGDAKGSEATLMPLLRKQDKPAWRTRAFTLAIAGDTKQAVQIAETILPGQLAQSIAPYLRYMPRLTPAQQAAAANLGKFPRASEIGHDDPRIAAYAPRLGARPTVAAADAALIPQGKPLGKDGAAASGTKASAARASTREAAAKATRLARADTVRVAPPDPKPAIERDSDGELPPVLANATPTPISAPTPAAAPTPAPPPSVAAQRVAVADAAPRPAAPSPATSLPAPASSTPASVPTPAPASSTPGAAPNAGFDLSALPSSQGGTAPPAERSPADILEAATPAGTASRAAAVAAGLPTPGLAESARAERERLSLAEAFADLGTPSAQAAPISGAVDIRKIEPARPEPKPEARPADATPPEDKKTADKKAADKTAAAADKKAAAKKPAKPAPPSHPSRIWVQLGVGRDKAAIAYDWRKWSKQAPTLFKGKSAYVSDMGRTNRILAGPFESNKAATAFIAQLDKAGIDGSHIWTSPAGQVVDALPAK